MLSDERFRGFNAHPRLEGSHAILSPSNYHWLRYPDTKLIERLRTSQAAALGTRLHAWAAESIELERYQPVDGDILCAYINDALEFDLIPEQMFFYSMNCYGTADTAGFDVEEMYLRIHDLKTGVSKGDMDQLYIYAALFCHEYDFRPYDIGGQLRIYHGDEVIVHEIDSAYLAWVYDRIQHSNSVVDRHKTGELI